MGKIIVSKGEAIDLIGATLAIMSKATRVGNIIIDADGQMLFDKEGDALDEIVAIKKLCQDMLKTLRGLEEIYE